MTFLRFIFAMFLSFLPGFIGILVTPMASGENLWYATLANSSLTPAGWVFSVVWTILYFLIGIALFLVMQNRKTFNQKFWAYTFFGINIILNVLWSFAFFGAQLPELALLVLATLIIVALFMARSFYKVSVGAFWYTVPYILWLMFAFYLNGMIIYLN